MAIFKIYFGAPPSGAGAVTGTIDAVEVADSLNFTGGIGAVFYGSLNAFEAAADAPTADSTFYSADSTLVTADAVNEGDQASFAGEISLAAVTGTLAGTEASDAAAFAGTVQWLGTLAATESADVLAASGTIRADDAWNINDKSANITLSNNDKTATLSSAVTGGVRSTQKYLNGTETGKFYVEFLLTNVISGFSSQVGLREVSAALNSSAGSTFQCATNSGNIVTGSATIIGNIGGSPLLDGDVVCMAWSPSTERGWFRKNGGLWNNDAAANPATNTNGLDISVLNNTDHALFFLVASSANGAITTIRTEAAELTYTAPSGFLSWMGESLAAEVTGTLAATEASDVVAISGLVGLSGTLTTIEASDVVAISGLVGLSGTLTTIEATDVVAFTGAVAWQGTLGAIEATDVVAFTGAVAWQGTLGAIEATDVVAINGLVGLTGTLNTLEGADVFAANGFVATVGEVTGSIAAVEASDTTSISGSVTGVAGTLVAAEVTTDTASFTGSVMSVVTGILAATEAGDALTASGVVVSAPANSGVLAVAEAVDRACFTGLVGRTGILAATEARDVLAISGEVVVSGVLAATESADTNALFLGDVYFPADWEESEGLKDEVISTVWLEGQRREIWLVNEVMTTSSIRNLNERVVYMAAESRRVTELEGPV